MLLLKEQSTIANSSRKNEVAGPNRKQRSAVDVFHFKEMGKRGSHLTAIQESKAQVVPSLSPEVRGAAGTISSWLPRVVGGSGAP